MALLEEANRKVESLEEEMCSIKQIKQQFMHQLLERQDEIVKLKESIKADKESSEEIVELRKKMDTIVRENHELKSRLYDETERNKTTKEENKELLVYLDKLLKERGE